MAHLHLCEREYSAETDPRAIDEREDMVVALDLLRLGRQTLAVIEPPLRLELLGVRAPDGLGAAHCLDRDHDRRPFRDVYGADFLAGGSGYGRREGHDVVFRSLNSCVS